MTISNQIFWYLHHILNVSKISLKILNSENIQLNLNAVEILKTIVRDIKKERTDILILSNWIIKTKDVNFDQIFINKLYNHFDHMNSSLNSIKIIITDTIQSKYITNDFKNHLLKIITMITEENKEDEEDKEKEDKEKEDKSLEIYYKYAKYEEENKKYEENKKSARQKRIW